MELTVEELKEVIKNVLKSIKEEGQKGRDGYVDDDVQPNGFGTDENLDFSQDATRSKEGNLYKRQGAANMGPWTSESVLRAVVREMLKEEFNMKPIPNAKAKSCAPFSGRASVGKKGSVGNIAIPEWKTTKKESSVWEDLARWYNVPVVKESVNHDPMYVDEMVRKSYSSLLRESKKKR